MPPSTQPISNDDPHHYCLGDEHTALAFEGECKHCDLLSIKVLRSWLAFFQGEQATPSLRSWVSSVDLDEAQEVGPSRALGRSGGPRARFGSMPWCFF